MRFFIYNPHDVLDCLKLEIIRRIEQSSLGKCALNPAPNFMHLRAFTEKRKNWNF